MQTLSTAPNIRRKPRPLARHAGRIERQSALGTAKPGADGFLNHSFTPLCHKGCNLPEPEATEQAFLQSAKELCRVHGISIADAMDLPYPHNILMLHRDIKRKLNRQPCETELFILKTGTDGKIALATNQVYEPGNTLYYIPVIPLYKFLKRKEDKATGELLVAVMSYLYREANIPYFRDSYCFMSGEYEYNREHLQEINENGEADDHRGDFCDLRRNDICGDIMRRKIASPYHLQHLADNINRFRPKSHFEEQCLSAASEALRLFRDFPGNTIFQNINYGEGDDELPAPDCYISFIGDDKGWIYDNIERSVNDFLGNYCEMAIPATTQVFDGTATKPETLEFEYRLFDLIINLCNILYDLP